MHLREVSLDLVYYFVSVIKYFLFLELPHVRLKTL